jgi:hypothetical protein
MANWKETLEPYVKVKEFVKTAPLNPTAGTNLIVGAVIISDRGPGVPTLISSQREFLNIYAAQDISEDYTDSLNELYTGDNTTLASTMWLNCYRLAGSGSLLISRACKVDGSMTYAKPLDPTMSEAQLKLQDYIWHEGEILKAVSPFKLVIDDGNLLTEESSDEVTGANDGWAISIRDVGVFGNRVNDNGPLYDYFVDNLYDLVEKLNESGKFYISEYHFYKDVKCEEEVDDPEFNKYEIKTVKFDHVFLASGGVMEPEVFDAEGNVEYWGYDSTGTTKNKWGDMYSKVLDTFGKNPSEEGWYEKNGSEYTASTDTTADKEKTYYSKGAADLDSTAVGCAYIIPADLNWESGTQAILDLNGKQYSGFEKPKFMVRNIYNSRVDLKVRIRRFNHNAIKNIQTEEGSTDSPYQVIKSVLDVYTKKGTKSTFIKDEPHIAESVLKYDFYEFCIYDPAVSSDAQIFNVGNVPGRGDITIADLNENLGSMHLELPQDLNELGIEYYGYDSNKEDLWEINANAKIGGSDDSKSLIMAGNGDIMRAYDRIELDERYIVEGLTDCGCTESIVQNYIANIATQSNYFYPVSSAASTNYMVIANKKNKITKRNSNIYHLAPYDLDDGTVGYLFNCMSSTLYWETVFANRRLNLEFAAAFSERRGVVNVVNLAKEFNKEERQLLLTKKINTIFRDVYLERIYINDNYTAQEEDNIWKEENNVRLRIRISKAMPVLLSQFKGRQNNQKCWDDVVSVVDYWFKTEILSYGETIADWQCLCDETLNPPEEQRANRLNVVLNVRFYNSVKYITVYHINKFVAYISNNILNKLRELISKRCPCQIRNGLTGKPKLYKSNMAIPCQALGIF